MVKDFVKNLCVSLETDIGGVSGATSRKAAVATPVITLTGNSVTITCDTTGATIYYTLDGSTPTSSSTQYSAAFTLDSSCTIKAIAIKGGKSSGIAEEEYVKPIIYLTQWKIVGNSEVHGTEIWSCGEYSEVDGKWHIRILPEGYGIVDIALDEPLRKVNSVGDSIEFADGVATLTRNIGNAVIGNTTVVISRTNTSNVFRWALKVGAKVFTTNIINTKYLLKGRTYYCEEGINADSGGDIQIFDSAYTSANDRQAFIAANADVEIIYELATPTTEVIQVPQIQEAESYSCVISQGGKAVSWSDFETE